MKFRTEIENCQISPKIEYFNSLFFIGSCFATNIGEECRRKGFKTLVNPFGVTYNPLSIIEVMKHICENKRVDKSMLRKVGEKYCSLLHHSSFDANSLDEVVEKTMKATSEAHEYIKRCSHIFITVGTSWVYIDKKSMNIVNNCHKIQDKEFIRRKLTVEEIVNNFSHLLENYDLLTNKKIIFTVSPIRHIKDTLAGNSLSKATLLTAIGELCEKFGDRVAYFPAYEIMLDDLRDYRFYEPDMLHPNSVAVSYIHSIFEKSLLSVDALDFCRKMEKIESARGHRVINLGSESHCKFKKIMLSNLLQIKQQYPLRDYDELISFFK